MNFVLTAEYKPTGDQPEAINQLTEGIKNNILIYKIICKEYLFRL